MTKARENAARSKARRGDGPDATSARFRPRALVALLPLLGLGAVVATYMVVAHLELFHGTGSFESLCNFSARLSCDAVNTSDQSEIGGVAVALFAIPAYAVLGFLAVRALRLEPARRRAALSLAHGIAWPAVVYSAFLLGVMVFQLGVLCLFCLTLDTVNVAALVLTAWSARAGPKELLVAIPGALKSEARRLVAASVGIGVAALALSLVGHAWLRSSLEAEARAAVLVSGAASSGSPTGAAAQDDTEGESAPGARKLPTKRWEIALDDDDAAVGPKDAKVVVVQFADFQCGYCKKLENAMAAVRKTFSEQVRFVFKHFPMNPRCNHAVQNEKHKFACDAAVSGECARRQGKFWPMHDELYKNQHRLERRDIDHYAALAGLDPSAFAACMDDPTALGAVSQDADEGARVKVNGTPRTFINGRLFSGALSEDLLTFVIRVELGQVTGKAAEAYAAPSATPAAADPVAAPPRVEVRRGGSSFTIDAFEASIDASGKAVSAPGVLPAEVSADEARRACEKAGERLCTSEEWVTACQGAPAVDDDGNGDFADDYIEGNQYPYANWYEAGVCRDAEDAASGRPALTGVRPGCRTPTGLYDLAGNVAEWVVSGSDRAVLLGGGSADREKAACYRPKRKEEAGAKGGFRCCK